MDENREIIEMKEVHGEFDNDDTPIFFLNESISSREKELKEILSGDSFWGENPFFVRSPEELAKAKKLLPPGKEPLLFVIHPKESHQEPDLVFKMIEGAQKEKMDFFVLTMSHKFSRPETHRNAENIAREEEPAEALRIKYPGRILPVGSYGELINEIAGKLGCRAIDTRIKSLTLNNIGHFENLSIDFDLKFTCFVGINGTGKTTILRAAALALTGGSHKTISREDAGFSLAGIKKLENERIVREPGFIELVYTMGGRSFSNRIDLIPRKEGNVEFISRGPSAFVRGSYFRSPVLGFPQVRGGACGSGEAGYTYLNRVLPPNINDLSPLINNTGAPRGESFSRWIADLDARANKLEEGTKKSAPERKIIERVFRIISEITDHPIAFQKVRQQSAHDVWVTTADAPQGIPLALVSLGFHALIGWIGSYMQRLAEIYREEEDFCSKPGILMIDEIDTYIHPGWQKKITGVLQKNFPATQFIITTHAPLVVAGLDRGQVIRLKKRKGDCRILAEPNPVDIWAWSYEDILRELYDTGVIESKYTLAELEEKIEQLKKRERRSPEEKERLVSLKENRRRLSASITYNNEVEQLKENLKAQDEELSGILKSLKEKKKD